MHVLICARPDVDVGTLADAWVRAAGHCTVDVCRLGGTPEQARRGPATDTVRDPVPGVLVPVENLGLRRAHEQVSPEVARLRAGAAAADLLLVAVPVLDAGTLHGAPVKPAASAAAPFAVPVVVLADRVTTTRREWSAVGISGVHELGTDLATDLAGRGEAVGRVARTWAPSWAVSSR